MGRIPFPMDHDMQRRLVAEFLRAFWLTIVTDERRTA